jgi:aspartyl-tRNA synthetase
LELATLPDVFAGSGFNAFAGVAAADGSIKGLAAPGGGALSRKELDGLVEDAKGRGAAGLVWIVVQDDGSVRSPVEKFLSADEIAAIVQRTGASPGDLVCLLAARLDLVSADVWSFCWMTEPPLFEWSDDEERWVSVHHPFTSPASDDLDPTTATARAYDLTLNGFEVGGGSIRIHRPEMQRRVFDVLGLSPQEQEEQFGHLLRALGFGAPPHGGIAMGIDRIVMLMAGKETIRDVTAFPKAQSGADPLTGAPAPVDDHQLRDLGIRLTAPKEAST